MLIREFAPAKINLYLHVTGRRTDGYHLLDSLTAFASVGDEIGLEPANGFEFTVTGPKAGPLHKESPDKNLVARAANALAQLAGTPLNVELKLTKNLPVASGIGGGSGDAAATLRALANHWRMSPVDTRVLQAAASCGQDVAPCLRSDTCYLTPDGTADGPELPFCHIVLANPGKALPTADVYKAFRESGMGFTPAARLTEAPKDAAALAALLKERRNDLTPAAIKMEPDINKVIAALENSAGCLLARMSGSGATCFGLYGDRDGARGAAADILAANLGWWVIQSHIPYRRDRRQNF